MLGEGGDRWLIRLHMQIGRELLASGWSQGDIAKTLGTTQSTVSRQLQRKLPKLSSADESVIDGWGHELVQTLVHLGPEANILRQRFVTEYAFSGGHTLRLDKTLTGTDLDEGQMRTSLLRRLEWTTSRLDAGKIQPWISGVGMNIAACLDEATTSGEVAAFPGRLGVVDNRIRHLENARFGASSHLSSILIDARKMDREKTSILNLRVPMNRRKGELLIDHNILKKATNECGWDMNMAPMGKIELSDGYCDILLDKGGFAWEPQVFVLAINPLDLVDRTHKFISALEA